MYPNLPSTIYLKQIQIHKDWDSKLARKLFRASIVRIAPNSFQILAPVHSFSNEISTKFWRHISHAVDSGLPSLRRWGKHCQVCDEFWGFGNKLRRAELPFERGSPAAILQFPSRQQKKSQIIYNKAKGTGGEREQERKRAWTARRSWAIWNASQIKEREPIFRGKDHLFNWNSKTALQLKRAL